MSEIEILGATIVDSSLEEHVFEAVENFQLKLELNLLVFHLRDGMFGLPLDRFRHFEARLSPRAEKPRYDICEVVQTSIGDEPAETVEIHQVLNYEWNAEKGLLMVFGKTATCCFHLDHVVFFHLKGPRG